MTKKHMQITPEVHLSEVLLIRISTCHLKIIQLSAFLKVLCPNEERK